MEMHKKRKLKKPSSSSAASSLFTQLNRNLRMDTYDTIIFHLAGPSGSGVTVAVSKSEPTGDLDANAVHGLGLGPAAAVDAGTTTVIDVDAFEYTESVTPQEMVGGEDEAIDTYYSVPDLWSNQKDVKYFTLM